LSGRTGIQRLLRKAWSASGVVAVVLGSGFFAPAIAAHAQAQEGAWSVPVNVSHSGGTANPRLVALDSGDLIAVWDDAFASPTASSPVAGLARRIAGEWRSPALASLPFAGQPSQMIAGRVGFVHGFWIDRRGSLRYASVPAVSYGDATRWQSTRLVATSVVAFDAVLDDSNRLHVIYLRVEDTDAAPAGVYYTRSTSGGQDWSFPIAVYPSTYYRRFLDRPTDPSSIYSGDVQLPHVDVAVSQTGNAVQVLLGWDNPALKRVFLLRSLDAGASWGEIQEIEGPEITSPYSEPRQLRIIAGEDRLLLLWQVAEAGGSCTLVYSSSPDAGETWTPRRPVLDEASGCPDGFEFLGSFEDKDVFFLTLQGQASLMAWDGTRWSLPQGQQALNYFVDEATYNFVEYGCRQAAMVEDHLYVVGCDQGIGGDVWVTERSLQDLQAWFDPAAGWAEDGFAALNPGEALSLAVVRDPQGGLRALWSQENAADPTKIASDVFYANRDANGVSGPFLVLSDLPGRAAELTAGLAAADRLTAIWGGGTNGELYQSWTSMVEAASAAGWSDPAVLEGFDPAGREPQLAVDAAGDYLLAYAVPLNERRGVYVATSSDQGQTWQTAGQAFDAVAAGCDFVERPSLALDGAGNLHLSWTCSTLPGGVGPLAVYYARSVDGGETWSDPVRLIERPAQWNQLVAVGDGRIHLIWQEVHGLRTSTWHIESSDDGLQWSVPRFLSATESAVGPATAVADAAGELHLLQVFQEGAAGPVLEHSLWDGQRWSAQEGLGLRAEQVSEISALTATTSGRGLLGVVYLGPGLRGSGGARQAEVVFASVVIDEPASRSARPSSAGVPQAATAPTAVLDATPTGIAPATPAPTLTFDASRPDFASAPLGIIAGIITAGVLIAAMFAFRSRPK